MMGRGLTLMGAIAAFAAVPADAQDQPTASGESVRVVSGCCTGTTSPVLGATSVNGATIEVDGIALENVWSSAEVATDFVTFEPVEGDPASERTEARVLYGPDALYVLIRAFDSEASEIVGQLTRRDQESHSDRVGVVIDSYFDRRTAFQFTVNPVGVKQDIYHFDDVQEDGGWDAVWDVATSIDEEGWTAEFRIPYSQLRFRSADEQRWGINFLRTIARKQETAVWAPLTRSEMAMVSRFGELTGLRGLSAPNRLEILPYSLARLQRAPGDPADPFYDQNDGSGAFGVDAKYGVTSNLTLDVTINPDFGQVEADPAQVNLSNFETFYPERRPFFVEGSGIFNFSIAQGDGPEANESLFYSRRVGRTPQGWADPAGGYVDRPDQTAIRGAWKLSGKTGSGWSIGALHAVTAEEQARVAPGSGAAFDSPVEPQSHYGVLRLQKDFREGRSAVGLIGTAIRRDAQIAESLGLRSDAYSGGLDFRHRFTDNKWELRGYLLGSHVRGSEAAIAATQLSAAHNYQRPDAGHVLFDPTRTSMTGAAADFSVQKIGGGFWRVGTGFNSRTAAFEVNDVGFMNQADYLSYWGWMGYHHSTPQGPFRNYFVNANAWDSWDWDGNRVGIGGNVNVNFQLNNFWHGYGGVNQQLSAMSPGALRGGPLFKREAQTNFWYGFGTDSRKVLQFNLNGFGNVRPESDSWTVGLSPNLRVRPSGRATFSVGSFLNRNVDDRQWIGRVDTTAPHYLFGRIEQTTVGVTARVDYAFTPTLSLQLYAQPFVSAGSYGEFKQIADPLADRYEDRFAALTTTAASGSYDADLDGDGSDESFRDPDFNFKQFRSNAVLRWEYLPGSTLFVVWSQGRDHFAPIGDFRYGSDVRDLFGVSPDDVFMVKVSYWLSR